MSAHEQNHPETASSVSESSSSDSFSTAHQSLLDFFGDLDSSPLWENPNTEGLDITFSRHADPNSWRKITTSTTKQLLIALGWLCGFISMILLGSTVNYVIAFLAAAVWLLSTGLGLFIIFGTGRNQNTGDRTISIQPDHLRITTEDSDDSFDWSDFSSVDISSSFFFLDGRRGEDIWLHLIPHDRDNFVAAHSYYSKWVHSRYPDAFSINLGWDYSLDDILAALQRCGVGLF
ncbi:MAG: hypothetical protein ACRDAX_06230 [Propionibacteriaceae bacterium]